MGFFTKPNWTVNVTAEDSTRSPSEASGMSVTSSPQNPHPLAADSRTRAQVVAYGMAPLLVRRRKDEYAKGPAQHLSHTRDLILLIYRWVNALVKAVEQTFYAPAVRLRTLTSWDLTAA